MSETANKPRIPVAIWVVAIVVAFFAGVAFDNFPSTQTSSGGDANPAGRAGPDWPWAPSSEPSAEQVAGVVASSDDAAMYSVLFAEAARHATVEFGCGLDQMTGWHRAQEIKSYQVRCAQNPPLTIFILDGGYRLSRDRSSRTYPLPEVLAEPEAATSYIATLEAEAASLPAAERHENVWVYTLLATLDPANERYSEKITEYSAPSPPPPSPPNRGVWRSTTNRSEIDDSSNIFLTVTADRDVLAGTFQASRPTLEIRCMENTTALVIDVGAYVGIGDTQVTLRIDDREPQTRTIGISTNYEAVGLWNGGTAIPYIQRLFGADRLTVRITPYGENAQTFAFPVAGLENVIGALREECGW